MGRNNGAQCIEHLFPQYHRHSEVSKAESDIEAGWHLEQWGNLFNGVLEGSVICGEEIPRVYLSP